MCLNFNRSFCPLSLPSCSVSQLQAGGKETSHPLCEPGQALGLRTVTAVELTLPCGRGAASPAPCLRLTDKGSSFPLHSSPGPGFISAKLRIKPAPGRLRECEGSAAPFAPSGEVQGSWLTGLPQLVQWLALGYRMDPQAKAGMIPLIKGFTRAGAPALSPVGVGAPAAMEVAHGRATSSHLGAGCPQWGWDGRRVAAFSGNFLKSRLTHAARHGHGLRGLSLGKVPILLQAHWTDKKHCM